MVIDDTFYMNLALDEAWRYQGLTFPNPSVGCLILHNGIIVALSAHQQCGTPHAEINALKEAFLSLSSHNILKEKLRSLLSSHDIHTFLLQYHDNLFHNATLYVTLEPCAHEGKTPSCALLLAKLQPKRVVIAHRDPNPKASGGSTILKNAGIIVEIEPENKRAYELIEPFLIWQKRPFVLFKWAQRLNGTIDEGIISSHESRTHVHNLRDKAELIIIGGETVRTDRPTLDSRLVKGKAPDVLIYSHHNNFDKTIPLFQVKKRHVYITNDLSIIHNYRFIFIEGGNGLRAALDSLIDWELVYIASLSGGTKTLSSLKNSQIMQTFHSKNDIIIWMKNQQKG